MSLYGGRLPRQDLQDGSSTHDLFEKVQALFSSDPWKVATPVLLGVGMAVAVLSLLLFLEDRNTKGKFDAEAKNK